MSNRLLAVAAVLALVGLGIVAYKVAGLDYELFPAPAPDRWSVQLEVRLEEPTADRARVAFFLPAEGPEQKIYDERFAAEGMRFYIRPRGGNRMGVVTGSAADAGAVNYSFSLQTLRGPDLPLPASAPPPGGEELRDLADDLAPEEAIQSDHALVTQLLDELSVSRTDGAAALATIHEFVHAEVETGDDRDGPQDAVSVLTRERGGGAGKARAAVALLRAAGVPARVVVGVPVAEGRTNQLEHWVEAYLAGRWWPADPVRGSLGSFPGPRLVLHVGDQPALEATGVGRIDYRVSMLRERQSQYMLFQRRNARDAPLLDKLSLHSLPVNTQVIFRVLLLIPLGALVVAIFRNLIGVPTFGTFMPILIALAFREAGIGWGMALLGVVVAIGYVGRWLLNRAQLLMVPRLSFLLTLVILIMAGVLIAGQHLGMPTAYSVALFPIVILTMTIERLSITIEEEGPRNAAKVVLGTLTVSVAGYAVVANAELQQLLFTFPELHLVTLALFLLLGRYTGYRLSEWTRFRAFRLGGVER
jgi:transglutaminase-like putative cysteine protease